MSAPLWVSQVYEQHGDRDSDSGDFFDNRLGLRKKDPAGNEYILLQGVGSLAVSDWVFYDENYQSVRMISSSINGPVAIAQSAAGANSAGWFLIFGVGTGNNIEASETDDAQVFVSGTAGVAEDLTGSGLSVYGAIRRTTGTSGAPYTSTYQLAYPFVLGTAPA